MKFCKLQIFLNEFCNRVKPLNSGHLRVLKKLFVIKRCPLSGGSLTKIITFETKHFVLCSRLFRYLGCPLLGGSTVVEKCKILQKNKFFWKIVLAVVLLRNFDILIIPCNILRSYKFIKSFSNGWKPKFW